jgi:hypothetical protein
MTARDRLQQQSVDIAEVLAWGAAAEAANAAVCAERDVAVRDLSAALQARDAARQAEEQAYVEREAAVAQVADRDIIIARRDATIAAKDAEIAGLVLRNNGLTDTNDVLDHALTSAREDLAEANAEIARLTALLNPFTVYNEMKSTGPIPGWPDILVVYESELFPSSVAEEHRSTTPPDVAFLDAFFANLFAQHGDVRLVLDSEAWRLITDVDSPTGIDMAVVGWYVTLVSCAKNAGFTNVGLYGEITERATLYLNYPVGHATHELRKSNWQARNAMCQPMWDVVDTIYPSFYPIKPIHNDAAKRDAWMDDNLAVCRERAPGKPVIPFLMARVHPSADETKPYLSGAYWRSWLEKVKSAGYDGLVVYQNSTDPDPLGVTPRPDWYLEAEAFRAAL